MIPVLVIDNPNARRRARRHPLMGEMIRKAFLLELEPGSLDTDVYWHDGIVDPRELRESWRFTPNVTG
jgi:hypothetical protein